MSIKQRNPFDVIFGRLLTASCTRPYGLPLFKVFPAPADPAKLLTFLATLQANGWDIEAALIPYKNEEQAGVCAFYDPVLDEYRFCNSMEFLRLNGYHISLAMDDSLCK